MIRKIAIIGASGFIGHHMSRFFQKKDEFDLLTPDKEILDITNIEDWCSFLINNKPDYMILLAGSKDVKKLEENYDFAYGINTQPVKNIISVIEQNKLSTKLIFFSSDYVFDGKKGDYKVSDETFPKTNYGKSKLEAEQALLNSNIHFKIIRTSAVMGEGGVFYEWLKNTLLTGNEINMFDNVYFTPTPVEFLNESILKIVHNFDNISDKIIHVVGNKKLSRYEFGLELKKELNSKTEIRKDCADISHSTFCNDLSMEQSDFIKDAEVE